MSTDSPDGYMSDYVIDGCDGALPKGIHWQGVFLWMTLRYDPDMWVHSSFIPTLHNKLFYLREIAGPLVPDCR
ncbi:MAG: hypothetical protein ACYCYM_01450 [Saccharofermentanales bacterium]